jgi:hypothetical protein
MIGEPALYGRGDAKRLVDAAVVVVHEVQGNPVGVVHVAAISFFGGGIVPHSGHRPGVARRS